ncbi:MAG: protein phosphatase 2C domain-containing protein [Desulfobacterales bacterium]|nr:protein phosphatase 2C domain-containing protein [Desulfobacterales bacterium]
MTDLIIDDFLKRGKTHFICEDYIISGIDPIPYIILSDGCSSSKNTDTGSRILTFASRLYLFEKGINPDTDYFEMGKCIINRSEHIAKLMGIELFSLDATLIISYLFENKVHIKIYGDGIIILLHNDGKVSFIKIDFEKNAPYYLSYLIDEDRKKIYDEAVLFKFIGEKKTKSQDKTEFVFSPSDYRSILIASDGVDSFIDKSGNKCDLNMILKEFTAFKNTNGYFIKRRAKRAIDEFEKSGIIHFDDIALGGFIFNRE